MLLDLDASARIRSLGRLNSGDGELVVVVVVDELEEEDQCLALGASLGFGVDLDEFWRLSCADTLAGDGGGGELAGMRCCCANWRWSVSVDGAPIVAPPLAALGPAETAHCGRLSAWQDAGRPACWWWCWPGGARPPAGGASRSASLGCRWAPLGPLGSSAPGAAAKTTAAGSAPLSSSQNDDCLVMVCELLRLCGSCACLSAEYLADSVAPAKGSVLVLVANCWWPAPDAVGWLASTRAAADHEPRLKESTRSRFFSNKSAPLVVLGAADIRSAACDSSCTGSEYFRLGQKASCWWC